MSKVGKESAIKTQEIKAGTPNALNHLFEQALNGEIGTAELAQGLLDNAKAADADAASRSTKIKRERLPIDIAAIQDKRALAAECRGHLMTLLTQPTTQEEQPSAETLGQPDVALDTTVTNV